MVHVFTAKHVLKCFAESEILSVTLDLRLNLLTSKMSLIVTSSDNYEMQVKYRMAWVSFTNSKTQMYNILRIALFHCKRVCSRSL